MDLLAISPICIRIERAFSSAAATKVAICARKSSESKRKQTTIGAWVEFTHEICVCLTCDEHTDEACKLDRNQYISNSFIKISGRIWLELTPFPLPPPRFCLWILGKRAEKWNSKISQWKWNTKKNEYSVAVRSTCWSNWIAFASFEVPRIIGRFVVVANLRYCVTEISTSSSVRRNSGAGTMHKYLIGNEWVHAPCFRDLRH